MDFAVPVGQSVKIKESKKIDKMLECWLRAEKSMEPQGDVDTYCIRYAWNGSPLFGGKKNWMNWKSEESYYSNVENNQNTQKSFRDLIWGLVRIYGIPTIVGYLMPNPFYTYILNIYDLVWLGFIAYQPL